MGKLNARRLHVSRAVAECLTAKWTLNKYYDGECLADILNRELGLEGNALLTATDIAKAFKGDEGNEYTLQYNDDVQLNLDLSELEGVGENDFLSVYANERDDNSSERYAIIGRFDSIEKMTAAYNSGNIVQRTARSYSYPLSNATMEKLQSKANGKRVYNNDKSSQEAPGTKKRKQSDKDDADGEDVSPEEINLRRLEEQCRQAEKANATAAAAFLNTSKKLMQAMAELEAAHSQLEASARRDRSVPQDEMSVGATASPSTTDDDEDNATTDDDDDNIGNDNILHFTFGSSAGSIQIDEDGGLRLDDLQQSGLPEGTKMGAFTLQRFGKKMAWVPNRAELIGKGERTKLVTKAKKMDKLYRVFNGERCNMSREACNVLAAGDLLAHGCGDESKAIISMCTCKALLISAGATDISNEAISKAMRKKDKIANDEAHLAALSQLVRRQEMRDDNVKHLGAQSDHGKRGGRDHLVIPVSWVAKGDFGLKIKSHVISTNHTGGTARATALGVQKAWNNFTAFDDPSESIELKNLTGDTGGGGAVQNLITEVKKLGVMSKECSFANCLLHGMNKPMENACLTVFGKPGMGNRSCWQLLYLWALFGKRMKLDSDPKRLDQMWAEVVKKIRDTNSQWYKLAEQCFPQLLNGFLDEVKTLETRVAELAAEGNTEEAAKAEKELLTMTTEYPKNIRDPVFSRWQTTDACARPFLRFFPVIYFFCVATVKSKKSSKSYIVKIAKAMLSLMNARTTPEVVQDSADEIDDEEEEDRAEELDRAEEEQVNESL